MITKPGLSNDHCSHNHKALLCEQCAYVPLNINEMVALPALLGCMISHQLYTHCVISSAVNPPQVFQHIPVFPCQLKPYISHTAAVPPQCKMSFCYLLLYYY